MALSLCSSSHTNLRFTLPEQVPLVTEVQAPKGARKSDYIWSDLACQWAFLAIVTHNLVHSRRYVTYSHIMVFRANLNRGYLQIAYLSSDMAASVLEVRAVHCGGRGVSPGCAHTAGTVKAATAPAAKKSRKM